MTPEAARFWTPTRLTTGAPRTLMVVAVAVAVAVALFAVIVCDRNPTAPWSATVTIGGTENVPAGQLTVKLPFASVTRDARSSRPAVGV
ncbi:hypothetical protein [Streptomyces sp. NPDC001480]|uniref:hypothetical protein n=1 Tax=Streptomyces sp. NPDC001480 TaxID=3364577 RepID=UPI00368F02A7